MPSQPEEKVTSLSKKLSYVLRHGALKENLKIAPDGFVKLDDLVSYFLCIDDDDDDDDD
jgi:2'-phosphotransferase